MEDILAIDFGTSYSSAAFLSAGLPQVVSFAKGATQMPSGVLWKASALVTGDRAAQQAALAPTAFEETPKRRIGHTSVALGDVDLPPADLVSAVLAEIVFEVRRQHDGDLPKTVRLTHPATWAGPRREVLLAAARSAGLGKVELVPEPVAAARFLAAQSGGLAMGDAVCVYDLGGGTFDAAVVVRDADGLVTTGRPSGIDLLGGVDFDRILLDEVITVLERTSPQAANLLADPPDRRWRGRRRLLREEVREAKVALSREPHAEIAIPDTGDITDTDDMVTIQKSRFEDLIRPLIEETVHVTRKVIAGAGFEPDALKDVYLVGGSSRIPLVAELLREGLGRRVSTRDDPKLVVAKGALLDNRPPVAGTSKNARGTGTHTGAANTTSATAGSGSRRGPTRNEQGPAAATGGNQRTAYLKIDGQNLLSPVVGGTVSRWLVEPGQQYSAGQGLVEVSDGAGSVRLRTPVPGQIIKTLLRPGDVLSTQPLGLFDQGRAPMRTNNEPEGSRSTTTGAGSGQGGARSSSSADPAGNSSGRSGHGRVDSDVEFWLTDGRSLLGLALVSLLSVAGQLGTAFSIAAILTVVASGSMDLVRISRSAAFLPKVTATILLVYAIGLTLSLTQVFSGALGNAPIVAYFTLVILVNLVVIAIFLLNRGDDRFRLPAALVAYLVADALIATILQVQYAQGYQIVPDGVRLALSLLVVLLLMSAAIGAILSRDQAVA